MSLRDSISLVPAAGSSRSNRSGPEGHGTGHLHLTLDPVRKSPGFSRSHLLKAELGEDLLGRAIDRGTILLGHPGRGLDVLADRELPEQVGVLERAAYSQTCDLVRGQCVTARPSRRYRRRWRYRVPRSCL